LDKKQANFYINMHSEEYLEEKNVPTNPGLWARAKTLARSKFDVYPSAYANGWAAKWYKGKGGSWKSVQEGRKMKTLKDILSEGVAVSSDFKLVNSVDSQGKPTTRKVRAHRKTINPQSEDKSDVLSSIQKFVGRQYDEEVSEAKMSAPGTPQWADSVTKAKTVKTTSTLWDTHQNVRNKHMAQLARDSGHTPTPEMIRAEKKGVAEEVEQVDEISKELTHSYFKKSIQDKSKENRKQRMSGQGRAVRRLTNKLTLPDQVAKEYSDHKPGQYVGDSYEPEGEMVEGQSAAIRMFKALQQAKKQREEEEARKAANEKRAQTPKSTNEAKDPREYDYEGDMAKTQLRSIIANSQAVHDMLKDTTNLAEWVQSKITKAEDYISTVADYMTAEMNEGYVAEAKEDDDEDYSKNHKLDPDSGVEADQHIHVQLKKAIDSTMKPYEVSFKNGKKHSVSSPVAKTIVTAIEKLKPEHRKAAHDELHKSYDSLMSVHKAITGK